MKLKVVSIIVPVYKAEDSIKKCINSILNQTYKKIELILVDDGSPDKSGNICDLYQEDERVKVIHTSNKGVSHARNVGLDSATGEYIAFCDSDDFYKLDYIENMLRTAIKYNSDITICGYYFGKKAQFKSSMHSGSRYIDKSDIIQHLSLDNEFGGFCWNKLYKTSIINDIRFPEDMNIMEDTYFLCAVIQNTKHMYYIAKALYYYCDNKNSAVRNIKNLYSDNHTIKYMDAWEKILTDFRLDKVSKNFIHIAMVKTAIDFRCNLKLDGYSKDKKLIHDLNKIVFHYLKEVYVCNRITRYRKIKLTVKFIFPIICVLKERIKRA